MFWSTSFFFCYSPWNKNCFILLVCPVGGGDKDVACDYWESLGYCDPEKGYTDITYEKCPVACGLCEGKSGYYIRVLVRSQWPVRAVFNWVWKVISRLLWFCITTLCDWLTKLAPLSQPMGIQTKTNRVLAARVFPRLAPITCICFEFWLARCVVYISCDWPE